MNLDAAKTPGHFFLEAWPHEPRFKRVYGWRMQIHRSETGCTSARPWRAQHDDCSIADDCGVIVPICSR
jgi:hypothetical protein